MKVPDSIFIRVSKIIQKQRFVKDILKSIQDRSGKVLLVGGAVRDLMLNLPIKDLDFEVYGLTLEQLENILQAYGTVSLVGKSFGVLKIHGLDIDWSLPRKDSLGRHPIVVCDPYMSYEQAFARRDLTINAMAIDMHTFEFIDPYKGLQDVHDKVLKAPDLAFFAQDPLRLLRVMQFAARFEMQVDEQLSELCKKIDISKISLQRIEQEFKKLLIQGKKPSIGLLWLLEIGKFHQLLPGLIKHEKLCVKLDEAAKLSYNCQQEKLVIMWAIISSFLKDNKNSDMFEKMSRVEKKPYIDFMRTINHQHSIINQVVDCVVYVPKIMDTISDVQIKWLAYWLAPGVSVRFLLRFYAILYNRSVEHLILKAEQLGVADKAESPILQGKDLIDIAQGKHLGLLIKKAYQMQLDYGLQNKDELLKML